MNVATQGELLQNLPYARRFARAMAGGQELGDALVADALRAGLPEVPAHLALYAGVAARVNKRAVAVNTEDLTILQRQLLLLTALEDLSIGDAATVVGLPILEAREHLETARAILRSTTATEVLVIEDEPIIAMDVLQLVESCGHKVIGVAQSEEEAI